MCVCVAWPWAWRLAAPTSINNDFVSSGVFGPHARDAAVHASAADPTGAGPVAADPVGLREDDASRDEALRKPPSDEQQVQVFVEARRRLQGSISSAALGRAAIAP